MTEIEKEAEERAAKDCNKYYGFEDYNAEYYKFGYCEHECLVRWETSKQAFIDGYEQGQKDFDTVVTKLLNSYGVTFIDTNSIGGLIGLLQFMLDLEKENEELKKAVTEKNSVVEKMNEQIEELQLEIKNNANCLNCSLYGSPYCKRKIKRYAPCKKWKSENSMIYDINMIGQKIDRRIDE